MTEFEDTKLREIAKGVKVALPLGKKKVAKAPVEEKTHPENERIWAIVDQESRRPYVKKTWTKEEAEHVLQELIEPYPKDSPWRKRLIVAPWGARFRKAT